MWLFLWKDSSVLWPKKRYLVSEQGIHILKRFRQREQELEHPSVLCFLWLVAYTSMMILPKFLFKHCKSYDMYIYIYTYIWRLMGKIPNYSSGFWRKKSGPQKIGFQGEGKGTSAKGSQAPSVRRPLSSSRLTLGEAREEEVRAGGFGFSCEPSSHWTPCHAIAFDVLGVGFAFLVIVVALLENGMNSQRLLAYFFFFFNKTMIFEG